MALDWLLEPVSEDQPCGPDLEKTDDPAFLDYYFEAEARLPERYFMPGAPNVLGGTEDSVFDPRTIDLRRETGDILDLLRRSRDLRLLSLLARFQILAARLPDFAATLEDIANLLEVRLTEVHPHSEGSASDRRGALDALGGQSTVVMPLTYLPILPNSNINFRQYQVATGAVAPRGTEVEQATEPDTLISLLKNPSNTKQIIATHAELSRAAQALQRISVLCKSNGAEAFTPEFAPTLGVIAGIQALIGQAMPDLVPWQADISSVSAPEVATTAEDGPLTGSATEPVATVQPLVDVGAFHIADQPSAVAALVAAEGYLVKHEPSSLSLLLVAQARMLVGKTIVEALELLLPQDAGRAQLTLGRTPGFTIDMSRMKLLAEAVCPKATDSIDPRVTQLVVIQDRKHLAGYLRGIEEFYMRNEPASPIPVLLGGARNMLTKSFHSILGEILPIQPAQG